MTTLIVISAWAVYLVVGYCLGLRLVDSDYRLLHLYECWSWAFYFWPLLYPALLMWIRNKPSVPINHPIGRRWW